MGKWEGSFETFLSSLIVNTETVILVSGVFGVYRFSVKVRLGSKFNLTLLFSRHRRPWSL